MSVPFRDDEEAERLATAALVREHDALVLEQTRLTRIVRTLSRRSRSTVARTLTSKIAWTLFAVGCMVGFLTLHTVPPIETAYTCSFDW